MLDLHPDVLVAVPTASGPAMRPIAKLLPDTFLFPDADADRVLRFNKRYYEAIVTRKKASTVRWDERVKVGPVIFYFEDDDAHGPLHGEIRGVNRFPLGQLSPDRLRLSGTGTVDAYVDGLREHYPSLPADASVDVVDFVLHDS